MFYIPLFDSGPSHSYTCILSCGGEPSVIPLSRASILLYIQMTVSSANICWPVHHPSKPEGAQSRSSSNVTYNTPPRLSYMSGTIGTLLPCNFSPTELIFSTKLQTQHPGIFILHPSQKCVSLQNISNQPTNYAAETFSRMISGNGMQQAEFLATWYSL